MWSLREGVDRSRPDISECSQGGCFMRFHGFAVLRFVTLLLALLVLSSASVLGQENGSTGQTRDTGVRPGNRVVANGQKMKVKGIIIRREADTFSVGDSVNSETVVLLTDRTSVKSKGGFFRSGKDYEVTSLLRGLKVEVEGYGNRDGQRSEEHTSELQSLAYLVCRLLLEKK